MKSTKEIWESVLASVSAELPAALIDNILRRASFALNGDAVIELPEEYMLNLFTSQNAAIVKAAVRDVVGRDVDCVMRVNPAIYISLDGRNLIVGPEIRDRFMVLTEITRENLWKYLRDDYEELYGGAYISKIKNTDEGKRSEKNLIAVLVTPTSEKGFGYRPTTIRWAWNHYLDDKENIREIWRGITNFTNMCNSYLRVAIERGPPERMIKDGPLYRCTNPLCHSKIKMRILYDETGAPGPIFPGQKCPTTINGLSCGHKYLRNDQWEIQIRPMVPKPAERPKVIRPEKKAVPTPEPPPVESPPSNVVVEDSVFGEIEIADDYDFWSDDADPGGTQDFF